MAVVAGTVAAAEGSTEPREYNSGATWKKLAAPV
jgi:hypothetical protein